MLISRSTASRLHVAHPSSPSAKLGTLHSIITPFLCKPFKEILCCCLSGGFFLFCCNFLGENQRLQNPQMCCNQAIWADHARQFFAATSGCDPAVFSAQILTALNQLISVQAYISIHGCLEICMTKHTIEFKRFNSISDFKSVSQSGCMIF